MPFTSLKLHADLLKGIHELGFTRPTPIQEEAIPPALAGRDVLAFRGGIQEHADLLVDGQALKQVLHIEEQRVGAERQRQRDADDDDVQSGRERRGGQPAHGVAKALSVMTQPGVHDSRP